MGDILRSLKRALKNIKLERMISILVIILIISIFSITSTIFPFYKADFSLDEREYVDTNKNSYDLGETVAIKFKGEDRVSDLYFKIVSQDDKLVFEHNPGMGIHPPNPRNATVIF